MISSDVSNIATVRNVFIIDDKGIIRLILIYPMEIGRSVSEIIRAIESLQTADNCNALTPLNWTPGNPVIQKPPKTFDELRQREQEIQKERNGISWYLSFKDASDCEKDANQ